MTTDDPTTAPTDGTNPPARPSDHDEQTTTARCVLPADAVILIPTTSTPPLQPPDGAWALLIIAADQAEAGADVVLFAGRWITHQPADCRDGDLVLRFTPSTTPGASHTTVEMLWASQSRWHPVGRWPDAGPDWPHVVSPTAATIMSLHTANTEAQPAPLYIALAANTNPVGQLGATGLATLLIAGLLQPGEQLVCDRRNLSLRHTARVRADGTLQLADGSVHATPSAATTALGGHHQNGWTMWRRAGDGRTLGELRRQYRQQHDASHR